eukprot:776167-Prymnesium_polylepis.2
MSRSMTENGIDAGAVGIERRDDGVHAAPCTSEWMSASSTTALSQVLCSDSSGALRFSTWEWAAVSGGKSAAPLAEIARNRSAAVGAVLGVAARTASGVVSGPLTRGDPTHGCAGPFSTGTVRAASPDVSVRAMTGCSDAAPSAAI